jgi:hypothetical protein
MVSNNNYINQIMALSQQPQFNNVQPATSSDFSGLGNAYLTPEEIAANYYAANPQLVPQVNGTVPQNRILSDDQLAPGVKEAFAQQEANRQAAQQARAEDFQKRMTTWSPVQIEGHPIISDIANLPTNAMHDIQEVGTGLVNILNNPKQNVIDPLYNYYAGMAYDGSTPLQRAIRAPKDMYNVLFGDPTKLNTQSLGKVSEALITGDLDKAAREAKRVGGEFYRNFMDNPFIVSSIIAPKPTSAAIGKAVEGVGKVAEKAGIPVGEMSRNVAALSAATKTKFTAAQAGITEATKEVRKASLNDLARVLKNTREGDARVPLNEKQIKLRDDVRKASIEYNKLIDDNALVSNREMSALQYVADTTGKTFQEVRRELTPQLELLQDGVTDQALRFENRLSNFEKDLNSFNKANKKNQITLKDDAKFTTLTGDAAKLFERHLTEAELAGLIETDATVGEAIQFLRDATRDAMTSSKVIDKAASNAKYQENLRKLGQLATESGDQTLQRFYEGIRLADKGEIFQTTFAGAEIPVGQTVSNIGRRFQGKSSSREFGTATPEAQAKAWKDNLLVYVDDVVKQRVADEFADNILKGTIDGQNPLVTTATKPQDVRYVNPASLAKGSLVEAMANVSKEAVDGWIPIDNAYVTAIKGHFFRPESAFKGTWGDLFKLGRSTMLASGNYLGGNVLSGAYGTLINETGLAGTVRDTINAIKSKGDLSKRLGTYREVGTDVRKFENPALGAIHKTNELFGGKVIRSIDATAQNLFSEINSHRALRQRGIDPSRLDQTPKAELGKIINDIRLSSMMPSEFRLIPAKAQGALGPVQPFINWTDTALQATYDIYRRHPYLAGMAAADFFGTIGLNKELQNRLNLGVYSDKPFVTYKPDQKTGGVKEVTIDFLPQMTAMKLLQHPKEIIRSGVPVISPILQSLQGRNQFGTLMKRTHEFGGDATKIYQNRRYKPDPVTGEIKPLEGGMGDEMLSTAIRSIWGVPALMNRTVGPTLASIASGISGKNIRYYQPYGQSIFGSFSTYQPDTIRAMFSSGNPASSRTLSDVLKGLGTYYENEYYPSSDTLSGRTVKAIRRQGARQNRREYQKFLQDLQGENR